MKKMRTRLKAFAVEHYGALIMMAFLLVLRLVALHSLGASYSLVNDDMSYVRSGIYFAQTGTITMHENYPSAQIMPGMTVLIGIFYRILGQERLLWPVLKVLWALMGTLTAWFVYRSVRIFVPRWCGVVAMIPLCRADFLWMDNLILTETPFMLALTALIYCTLMMWKKPGYRYFWGAAISYMAALMLKANIGPYPVFALIFLLIVRYDKKLLLRQCAILAGLVLCFVIPWSIRNYMHFHAFVPLTYGAGNPTLLGTYQGVGYPLDEELDYEANVDAVVRERYAYYYGEDGDVQPQYQRYVALARDGVKASYRKQVWAERDLKGMVYSYLVIKPRLMINSAFYWHPILDISGKWVSRLQRLDTVLCAVAIVLSLVMKKARKPVLLVAGVYLVNIYIYAMTFAFDRYNASLMSLRFILLGIGAGLAAELVSKRILKKT